MSRRAGFDKLMIRMVEEGINRPSWRDGGGAEGPIASAWNVQVWSTIYVLDAGGVIRYEYVRKGRWDEAVDSLLGGGRAPSPGEDFV